jgi:hypothetical protein
MTTVTIDFSQSVLATLETYRAAHPTATLAQDFDKFVKAGYNFATAHNVYTGGSLAGPDGYLDYPDGAFQTFAGLVNTTPGAASGTFSAGSLEDHVSGNYRLVYDGQLNFGYTSSASNGLLLSNQGGTINTLTLQQLVTSGSTGYDATIGNTVLKAHGAVTSDGNLFSGEVDTLTRTTELFEQGGRITGSFNVSGDSTAIGQDTASTAISGTLTSYAQYYTDGSSALISGAEMAVTGSTVANEQRLLANAANFGGDDAIAVTLPAIVNTDWLIASGAGNDRISLTGGGARLSIDAGSGRDTIVMNDYGHKVDGGDGVDTAVFAGKRADYTVAAAAGGYTVSAAAAGGLADTLVNIERIQFSDSGLALDSNGSAGQLFRLYQSAFNRAPDVGGAGFWLKAMDNGLTLEQIAAGFTQAPEFKNLYGDTTDPVALVTSLYHNALDREPEPGGMQFWLDVLARGVSVPQVMLGFSESPESQGLNAALIANGYTYTPFV